LMNYACVASRFDGSRRRHDISWSHHAEVAAVGPDLQIYWLKQAIADRLSLKDLRRELRGTRAETDRDVGEQAPSDSESDRRPKCPTCGQPLPPTGSTLPPLRADADAS
jgi:hypothetical protein